MKAGGPRSSTLLGGVMILLACLASSVTHSLDKITYFHQDALGSTIAATNEVGAVTWRERYLSYGTRVRREDGESNALWYTGKPEESDFGLQYFGARWYDSQLGAFLATDPVSFTDQNPMSFNRYVYANASPYGYVDPDGRIPIDTLWDLGNVAYDIGKITVGWATGNESLVIQGGKDLFADSIAMAVPYVPAGATKLGREGVEQAVKREDEIVNGYRAVSRAEADDIAAHGFRPNPNGQSMQDKWFSETRQGAEKFKQNYPDLDEIIKAKVPKDVYERSYKHPNIDQTGPGFCVACKDLNRLKVGK